jgi:hypothetical protein
MVGCVEVILSLPFVVVVVGRAGGCVPMLLPLSQAHRYRAIAKTNTNSNFFIDIPSISLCVPQMGAFVLL